MVVPSQSWKYILTLDPQQTQKERRKPDEDIVRNTGIAIESYRYLYYAYTLLEIINDAKSN